MTGGDYSELVGVEVLDVGPEGARARIEVGPQHLQPFGTVHGGVYASLAEAICSVATYTAVHEDGMVAMAQSNATTFVRPVTEGTVTAVATPRQRGRTTWVWDCDLTDDDDRICALARLTIAVRPGR